MFFKKKKKDLKIQDVSADCPDYTVEKDEAEIPSEEKKQKKQRKSKMRKIREKKRNPFLIILLFLVIVAGAAAGFYFFGIPFLGGSSLVYVERVSNIMELGSGNGTLNRYAGIVESQGEWSVAVSGESSVKEVYVKEGDTVAIGDKLFAYDDEEIKLNLEQTRLELERMESEIDAAEAQISSLERQKEGASSSEKLEIEIQIQSLKANNKKTEYEIKSQEATIASLEKASQNTVVKSELAGVVKNINQSVVNGSAYGETEFITILATGDYRIKATVNEQNQWAIEEGAAVIIRSRVDDTARWTGKILTIDTENPEAIDDSTYSDTAEMSASSRYPFYVKLDSWNGLILGQHVYVELDNGQDEEKEGVWLEGYYFIQEEDKTYVWAQSGLKLLEKREVTLGEFDEEAGKYQVLSGLDLDDYVAFPTDGLWAGARTTTESSETSNGGNASDGQEEQFQIDDDSFQSFDGEDSSSSEEGDDMGPVGSLDRLMEVLL